MRRRVRLDFRLRGSRARTRIQTPRKSSPSVEPHRARHHSRRRRRHRPRAIRRLNDRRSRSMYLFLLARRRAVVPYHHSRATSQPSQPSQPRASERDVVVHPRVERALKDDRARPRAARRRARRPRRRARGEKEARCHRRGRGEDRLQRLEAAHKHGPRHDQRGHHGS